MALYSSKLAPKGSEEQGEKFNKLPEPRLKPTTLSSHMCSRLKHYWLHDDTNVLKERTYHEYSEFSKIKQQFAYLSCQNAA